ncbi:MAG: hypothetical protein WD036_02845 [Bauldia sp.]
MPDPPPAAGVSNTPAPAGEVRRLLSVIESHLRPAAAAPRHGYPLARPHLPVMIVCSPRPRVGRTLIARLLVEFFLADDRRAVAYDLNPNDPVLSDWLPFHAVRATIGDTRGVMALFDRLIVNDGRPKVIDLAADLFDAFFDVMLQIGLVDGARARGIDTVVLFVAEDHPRSTAAYRRIVERFDQLAVVPVHNKLSESFKAADFLRPSLGATAIHIDYLSPFLHGVVNRPRFSFVGFLAKPSARPTMLHDWIDQSFVAFRDLELRLLMSEFAPLFRHAV